MARGRGGLGRLAGALLLGAVVIEGSACAVQPEATRSVTCSVTSKAKVSPQLGDEAAICAPIMRAAEDGAREAGLAASSVTIQVELLSAHSIAATAFVDGRALPRHRVNVSDRSLDASSVARLARSVGSQLAQLRTNS